MTLPDAIAFARKNQPSVLAAAARITAAKANAQIPRAQWMPLLAGSAQLWGATSNNSTTVYEPAFGVDLPRIGGTAVNATPVWTPSASTVVAVGLHQEVFDFGRIAAQDTAADTLVDVSRQQSDIVRLDIDLDVTNAYFSVVAAHEVLAAAEQAVQRMTVDRDAAAAGVKSGLVKPVTLTLAEADLARADVGRIQAEGGLESAQVVFAAITGVPDPRLDAAGTPPQIQALPELSHVVAVAREHDPDLLVAETALSAQQANTQAIAATLRPDLQLSGTLSSRGGGAKSSSGNELSGDGFAPIVPNYSLGLLFSWPLYDAIIGQQSNASRQLEDVRREDVANANLAVSEAVQQAYVQAQIADQAIPALERSVNAAEANDDQARTRFKAGLGTEIDIAYAEDLLVQAQIQLAIGRYAQARARAQLARVMAENP